MGMTTSDPYGIEIGSTQPAYSRKTALCRSLGGAGDSAANVSRNPLSESCANLRMSASVRVETKVVTPSFLVSDDDRNGNFKMAAGTYY